MKLNIQNIFSAQVRLCSQCTQRTTSDSIPVLMFVNQIFWFLSKCQYYANKIAGNWCFRMFFICLIIFPILYYTGCSIEQMQRGLNWNHCWRSTSNPWKIALQAHKSIVAQERPRFCRACHRGLKRKPRKMIHCTYYQQVKRTFWSQHTGRGQKRRRQETTWKNSIPFHSISLVFIYLCSLFFLAWMSSMPFIIWSAK